MTNSIKRVFVIDDDESFRQLIIRFLNLILPEARVDQCDPSIDITPLRDCNWQDYDLVLLDYFLSDTQTGLDLLKEWQKLPYFPPVIMLTAAGNEEVAVRAMKSGISDYIRKQNITKEKLKGSILDAVTAHQREREHQQTITQSSQSFNKSLFYKQLEQPVQAGPDEHGPVLVLLELDNYEVMGDEVGIVTQDNVIRHIARVAFEIFKDSPYQPVITRITDMAVAMLLQTMPDTSLSGDMAKLTEAFIECPYEYDDNLIPYTVSIGVVRLQDVEPSVTTIIKRGREACQTVRARGGNGYHIYRPAPDQATATARPAAKQQKAPSEPTPVKEKPAAAPAARPPSPVKEPQPAEEAPAPSAKEPEPVEQAPAQSAEKPEPVEQSQGQETESIDEKLLLDMTLEMPIERDQSQPAASGSQPQALPAGTETAGDQREAADFDILQAFDDNRVLQYYQPIMPLSEQAAQNPAECFSVRVRMVNTDGSLIDADQIITGLKHARNQRLLDRWMLRETVGRTIQFKQNMEQDYQFIVKLSEESFADANLFNWMQNKLMKQVARLDPGRSIVIEISTETYLAKRKQIEALMKFMRQAYHFRFAVSAFENAGQVEEVLKSGKFDMFKISHKLLHELMTSTGGNGAVHPLLDAIRQQGLLLIITFIENGAMLTEAINAGADYGMGYFIGEPVERIGEMSQIESFEIT